jgi:hypothetical protein
MFPCADPRFSGGERIGMRGPAAGVPPRFLFSLCAEKLSAIPYTDIRFRSVQKIEQEAQILLCRVICVVL